MQRIDRFSEKRRRIVTGLSGAMVLASISGCAPGPTKPEPLWDATRPPLFEKGGRLYVRWTEEVQLSDGRIIIAERADEYRKVSDPGQGWGSIGWLYQRGSFSATLPEPASRTVSWEGTLKPLVLDIVEGEIYFVGAIAAGFARDEWKVPDDQHYVVFRSATADWIRIQLVSLPRASKPNFLIPTREFFQRGRSLSPGSSVGLKRKAELNADPLLPASYRTIVRPKH